VPLEAVIAELRAKLSSRPDFITFSGSGEPTLYSRLGELIDRIRAITEIPVAILTNGSLLHRKEVRDELRRAHLVIPSLDAGDAEMFQAVNRPHRAIEFQRMVDGLAEFRDEFSGEYLLEVLLLGGHTGMAGEVRKIARIASRIRPDRVQLNSVTRPPAERYAYGMTAQRLDEMSRLFEPPAEVIAACHSEATGAECEANQEEIVRLLRRRPCTLDDIARGLGMHQNEILKHLQMLLQADKVESRVMGDWSRPYYRIPVMAAAQAEEEPQGTGLGGV